MLAIASKIILCLVLAALLGLIIGYLLGKANCPKNAYKEITPDDPHTKDDDDCGGKAKGKESNQKVTASVEEKISAQAQGLMDSDKKSSQKSSKTKESATQAAQKEAEETKTKDTADKTKDSSGAKTQKTTAKKATDSKEGTDNSAKASSKTDKAAKTEQPSDDNKPSTLLKAPRDGKKDNLKRIKGIGDKIEKLLNDTGVYHFDQIAAWSEKEAEWIDHKVSFPGRAKRDDWIGQAKLLAQGKETEFSKRVDAGEVATSKK